MFQQAPCTGADRCELRCFRISHSMPLTLLSLRSLHLTINRTKSVADCGNFWRKSLAFSSVRALHGLPLAWPPVNCACVPQLFEQLINVMLCPSLLGKFVCLCCVPLQIQTLAKSYPRRLISCWLLTNTAVTSAVTNLRCHKLITKVNR